MRDNFPSLSMPKNYHAYAAELLGTFLLAFLVHLGAGGGLPVPTAVIAGLTLGLIVYMLGPISGAHVNPAVTIGLASIGKIAPTEAAAYVVSQLLGGFLALLAGNWLLGSALSLTVSDTPLVGIAEAIGAAILVLGVCSVVYGKAPKDAAGLTIGTSLTLGALAASVQSNGIVNPAVALGLGSLSVMYVVGPLLGGIVAAWGYKLLAAKSN
jgi:glycerol uptake facilitator-like aquaporin